MPQDLGFRYQSRYTARLLIVGLGSRHDEGESLRAISFRARYARAEIVECVGSNPRVVVLPCCDPVEHEIRRKTLRERRGNCLDQECLANERDIRVTGEANSG